MACGHPGDRGCVEPSAVITVVALAAAVVVYLRRLRDSTVVGGVLHVARCGSSWPLLEIESSRGESPLTRLVGRIPANGVTVMAGRSTWLRAVLATAVAAPIQRPQGLGYTVESVRGGLLESCFLTEILDCDSGGGNGGRVRQGAVWGAG